MTTVTVIPSGQSLSVHVAKSLLDRLRGLIGRPSPGAASGLIIERCRKIHTIGMSYPIDVIYIDAGGVVVHVADNVPSGRYIVPAPSRRIGARHVLEMGAGEAARMKLSTGMRLTSGAAGGLWK